MTISINLNIIISIITIIIITIINITIMIIILMSFGVHHQACRQAGETGATSRSCFWRKDAAWGAYCC